MKSGYILLLDGIVIYISQFYEKVKKDYKSGEDGNNVNVDRVLDEITRICMLQTLHDFSHHFHSNISMRKISSGRFIISVQ